MGQFGRSIGSSMTGLRRNRPERTQFTVIRGVAGVQTPAFVERWAACHSPSRIPEPRRAGRCLRSVQSRVHVRQRRGVLENDAEALRWYRLAAEQGDASAQTNLGVMSANGEGVPENTVNAYAWFSIAAAQGNTSAKELKELVTGLMVRSQIAEAQGLALEYWNLYVLPFQ